MNSRLICVSSSMPTSTVSFESYRKVWKQCFTDFRKELFKIMIINVMRNKNRNIHSTSTCLEMEGQSMHLFCSLFIYDRKQINDPHSHRTWKFHNKFNEKLCSNVIHFKLSPNKVWHITLKIKLRWPPCGSGRSVY